MTLEAALDYLHGLEGTVVRAYVGPRANPDRNTVFVSGVLLGPFDMQEIGEGLDEPHADMLVEGAVLFRLLTVEPALGPQAMSGFLLSRETFDGAEVDDDGKLDIDLTTGERILVEPL